MPAAARSAVARAEMIRKRIREGKHAYDSMRTIRPYGNGR